MCVYVRWEDERGANAPIIKIWNELENVQMHNFCIYYNKNSNNNNNNNDNNNIIIVSDCI